MSTGNSLVALGRKRWIALGTLAALAVAWSVTRSGHSVSRPPEPTAEVPATPSEPLVERHTAPEISAAPEVSAPPAVAVQPPPAASAAAAAKESDENAPFKTDVVTVEARLRRAAEREELDHRWASEAADPAWSTQVKHHMVELLAADGVSARALDDVDCRQTICRLKLTSSSERKSDVMSVIHAARELHVETWLLPEQDEARGTYGMEVFMPREGFRLSGGGGKIDQAPKTDEVAAYDEH
jgi:hypothetical protein